MKSFIPVIILLSACRNHTTLKSNSDDTLALKNDSVKNEPYYPITQYVLEQIAYVDSTPLAIEKQTFINGKRIDSTIINRIEFKLLAEEFMKPNLNDKNIKPLYVENMYQDLTINSITFNYTTSDPGQELKQADVLLNPETKKVKNIIFRKTRTIGDTTYNFNGLWKHYLDFQINYAIQPGKGKAFTKQVKVIWDKPTVQD